jgi:membrane-bound inhibitor of C-type lysozyme
MTPRSPKTAIVSLLTVAALTAGCSREAAAPPAQPQAPASTAAQTPPAPPIGYACESGKTVTVQYPDTATAQLNYNGQTYVLRTVQAASGARYAGSGVEWWTATRDGQESATLSRLGPNQDVGVAILERCSRPASGVDTPVGPTPLPTPAPGGVLPAALPCKSNQLKLSADGGDAGMGHRLATLGVQNIGPQACSLTGYPAVVLLDGRGRSLTTIKIDQHPGSYLSGGMAPRPVNLAPQAKGYFDIAWTVVPNEGAGERVCPGAATVRFSAPGDTNFIAFAQAFTPCGGRIDVSPIRPTTEDVAPAATT